MALLEDGLNVWRSSKTLAYAFKRMNMSELETELLRGIVVKGAFAGSRAALEVSAGDVATSRILHDWLSNGLVDKTRTFPDSSSWQLAARHAEVVHSATCS